jgi:hypothetical protein
MRGLMLVPAMAAALLLAGCEVKVSGDADATSGDEAPVAAAPKAAEAPAAGGAWQAVKVVGLTCGDNCYVQIEPAAGGAAQEVMCTADACTPWFEEQALPGDAAGKTYEVQMGTAEQVDAEGTVQSSDFPAITAIRDAS